MKTKMWLLTSIFLIIAVFTSCFWGCKESTTNEPQSSENKFIKDSSSSGHKTVSSFAIYGKLHNAFLTNIKNNFNAGKSLKGKTSKLNYLAKFHQDFCINISISESRKNDLKKYLSDFKKYHDSDSLLKGFDKNVMSDIKARNSLKKVNKTSMLAPYEQQAIDNLCQTSYDAYQGIVSVADFQSVVNQMAESYDEYYSETSLAEDAGTLLGICLAITQSSIEWWQQNPDALIEDELVLLKGTNKSKVVALPPWIAYDALGALGSGIGRYMAERLKADRNHTSVDWGAVAGTAVAGAVGASTGIVGKVFKWLTGWF